MKGISVSVLAEAQAAPGGTGPFFGGKGPEDRESKKTKRLYFFHFSKLPFCFDRKKVFPIQRINFAIKNLVLSTSDLHPS